MGMLFIELAQTMIAAHDAAFYRGGGRLTRVRGLTWEHQLGKLVRLGDSEGGHHHGLLRGLLRRIGQSLYLQTARGAQLQAALIAITADPAGTTNVTAESCDTAQNEADRLMEWWDTRRKYMDLGEDSGAKGSDAAPLAGEEQGKSPVRRGRGITCADLLVQGSWLQCIGGCNGSICSTCAAGAFLGSTIGDLILNNYLCYCRG